MIYATLKDLRDAGRLTQRALGGVVAEIVSKSCPVTETRNVNQKERTIDVVFSSSAVDRYGDIVRADGGDWNVYSKHNPVVLADHKSGHITAILGKSLSVFRDGDTLWSKDKFMPKGMSELSDVAWDMISAGFLNSTSVGFLPRKHVKILDDSGEWTGGFEFQDWEKVEHSWVTIPANPTANVPAEASSPSPTSCERGGDDLDEEALERQQLFSRLQIAVARMRIRNGR